MQALEQARPLDSELVARIVRFVCLDPLAGVHPESHIAKVVSLRFGMPDEFYQAIEVLLRTLREYVRMEQAEADLAKPVSKAPPPRARDSRARLVFGRYEIRVIERGKPQLLHAVNAQDEDACGAQHRNEREIRGDDQFQAHHPRPTGQFFTVGESLEGGSRLARSEEPTPGQETAAGLYQPTLIETKKAPPQEEEKSVGA